jgi:3',5'-cyclic AMP phosphodiesterase CpdA
MNRLSRRQVLKAGLASAMAPVCGDLLPSSAEGAEPYADAILKAGEPPAAKDGFTIAVLPDTQNYSEKFPEIFQAQTEWLLDNKARRNIACVLQLGDVTNHNTPAEWENAVKALKVLHGKLPLAVVPGNHDYSKGGGCKDRTTLMSQYLPVEMFQGATFGGVYDREPERSENSFHLVSAGGRDLLLLGLEFGPRRDVVRWANEVVGKHPKRGVILLTHAYMYFDETRYDWKQHGVQQAWNPHSYGVAETTADDVLDGEELWTELVSRHENFLMTLNGHVLNDGLGRLTSQTPGGRDVHQMLVNFQMKPKGGDGWLRLLEFGGDGTTLRVYDYSPTRNQRNESAQNQFQLKLASA